MPIAAPHPNATSKCAGSNAKSAGTEGVVGEYLDMKDMSEYLKTALSIPPKFVRHGKTAGASKKKPASKNH